MVLLLGSDAYSPFRMDALKDAIAKAAPELAEDEGRARRCAKARGGVQRRRA